MTFEVRHEDAYNFNVDEAPHAAAAFMANLMQTSSSTRQGTSNDIDFHLEVQTYDNHFFDNMNLQDLHKSVLGHRNPLYLTSAQLCRPALYLAESVSKDICSDVLTSDIAVPMSVEPRSNCVKEHSRNMELEVEILKEVKAQTSNMKEVSAGTNLSTLEFQALETKNTQLKEELTAVRIKNDSLRDDNVSIKKRYQDLYQSKAESNSNVSSGAVVPKKPKSGGIGYGLVTSPTTPSVPPIKKQLSELFQPLFDDDEEFSPDVHPHLVNVASPSAPEIAHDSPSTKTVTEDAPTATTITSPS
nr:hypothetical protein [Tanacetum cinerariifolium]